MIPRVPCYAILGLCCPQARRGSILDMPSAAEFQCYRRRPPPRPLYACRQHNLFPRFVNARAPIGPIGRGVSGGKARFLGESRPDLCRPGHTIWAVGSCTLGGRSGLKPAAGSFTKCGTQIKTISATKSARRSNGLLAHCLPAFWAPKRNQNAPLAGA